ncbi:protein of unknown function [Nitrosotalea devaniterrae]|uniref:Uncharacterized protein n=1 Tax=Nitrosotalea devaniterrae TaxID=1078905 RepID=A0A128A3X8_9ARCH|nr:protein of unknown function [Candidatus Nitrosotalea devanaterra]
MEHTIIENPNYVNSIVSWYESEIDKLIETPINVLKTDFAIKHLKALKISLNKIQKQIGTNKDSTRLTLDESDLIEFKKVIFLVFTHYEACLDHDQEKILKTLNFKMEHIENEKDKARTYMNNIYHFKSESKDPPPPVTI